MNEGPAVAAGPSHQPQLPEPSDVLAQDRPGRKQGSLDEQEEGLASNTSCTVTAALVPTTCPAASQAMSREGRW